MSDTRRLSSGCVKHLLAARRVTTTFLPVSLHQQIRVRVWGRVCFLQRRALRNVFVWLTRRVSGTQRPGLKPLACSMWPDSERPEEADGNSAAAPNTILCVWWAAAATLQPEIKELETSFQHQWLKDKELVSTLGCQRLALFTPWVMETVIHLVSCFPPASDWQC